MIRSCWSVGGGGRIISIPSTTSVVTIGKYSSNRISKGGIIIVIAWVRASPAHFNPGRRTVRIVIIIVGIAVKVEITNPVINNGIGFRIYKDNSCAVRVVKAVPAIIVVPVIIKWRIRVVRIVAPAIVTPVVPPIIIESRPAVTVPYSHTQPAIIRI